MASLLQMGSPLLYSKALVKTIQRLLSFTCTILAKTTLDDESPVVSRRSAKYQPSLWDHHNLLSVENKYSNDKSVRERDLLKENVRKMLDDENTTHTEKFELIDDLQKLGVSYHFEREIDNILTISYQKDRRNFTEYKMEKDLHATGWNSDYSDNMVSMFQKMVVQALDMPYYWRMRRLATRWYIDMYGKRPNKNLVLIEFAKLDFNIVQAVHQEELKFVASWWRETGLANQLHFARDRIVENYFWTLGQIQEPQFGYVRRVMAKINALLTTIDDIYDIYGTLEELQLFTSAFENWDVNRLDELPEYMRLCFLVVYNEVNSIGCDILRTKNINVIPFLKKSWADVCNAYLVEAIWYKREYKPNMEEYMQNACISIAAPTIFVHFYCVFSDQLSIQVLETLSEHQQKIVRCSASVFRLVNDLVTSPDELARGDVLKSIQCYMNETGASEVKARVHVRQMINEMWDEMNYEKMQTRSSLIPQDFVESVMNLARMSQCMYQYGDGHGAPEKAKITDRIASLLFTSIPLD